MTEDDANGTETLLLRHNNIIAFHTGEFIAGAGICFVH